MPNSLIDVMNEIKKENPSYNEVDIENAVNAAQKQYQPDIDSPENLVKIKEIAIGTLNFSANL